MQQVFRAFAVIKLLHAMNSYLFSLCLHSSSSKELSIRTHVFPCIFDYMLHTRSNRLSHQQDIEIIHLRIAYASVTIFRIIASIASVFEQHNWVFRVFPVQNCRSPKYPRIPDSIHVSHILSATIRGYCFTPASLPQAAVRIYAYVQGVDHFYPANKVAFSAGVQKQRVSPSPSFPAQTQT